jgi:hypothetical protein
MAVFATIYARSAISGSLCVARLHFCISSPLPFSPTHTLHPSTVVSILPSSIPSPFPFLHPHSLVHSSFCLILPPTRGPQTEPSQRLHNLKTLGVAFLSVVLTSTPLLS